MAAFGRSQSGQFLRPRTAEAGVSQEPGALASSSEILALFTSPGPLLLLVPQVIAAIGRLPETLADRSIVIRMERKTAKERCGWLRNLETGNLKRFCARFVLDHADAIASALPDIPAGLNDRAADIWEPLIVLADLAGGHWPQTARQAAETLTAAAHETNPIGSLLFDICVAFILSESDRLFSRTLVAELNGLSDRPWMHTTKSRQIDESWLSRQLRPYGVQPRTIRINGPQGKGYLMEDFRETFRRYIPKSELDALRAEVAPAVPPAPPACS